MGAADYLASLPASTLTLEALNAEGLADTPWDPALAVAMKGRGVPAFEEALLPELMRDLAAGAPPTDNPPSAQ